jgi:hypothetical protein
LNLRGLLGSAEFGHRSVSSRGLPSLYRPMTYDLAV